MASLSNSPFEASADARAFPPPEDLDDAYENIKFIANANIYMQAWEQQSAALRASTRHVELDRAYGSGARQRYDLFWPANGAGSEKGLVVFLHGGYWLAFSKDSFSHLAAGALTAGWAVAVVSYTLAPEARISQITAEITAAVNCLSGVGKGPMRLVGHSAGGHLVCRMMCDDTTLEDTATNRIDRVVSISGLHDLRPLVHLEKNSKFRLDRTEATNESAICHTPRQGIRLVCVAGANERPEFVRQNGILPLVWQGLGAKCHAQLLAGEDHLSIIGQMTRSDSRLSRLIDAPLD